MHLGPLLVSISRNTYGPAVGKLVFLCRKYLSLKTQRPPEGGLVFICWGCRNQLERARRFERPTLTLARLCSTPELRPHPLVGREIPIGRCVCKREISFECTFFKVFFSGGFWDLLKQCVAQKPQGRKGDHGNVHRHPKLTQNDFLRGGGKTNGMQRTPRNQQDAQPVQGQ